MCCGTNLFAWNMLYPYNFMTNFGGRYQFNLIDTTQYNPQEAYAIRNALNPFYHLNSLCQNLAMSNVPDSTTNIFANAGALYGANRAMEASFERSFQLTSNDITGLKSQLEQALASDKLTAAQKNQLRALKRELEALEDKLENIAVLKQNGATSAQLSTAISQIRAEYREIRDRVQAAADRIRESVENNSGSDVDETDGSDGDADGSDDSSEASLGVNLSDFQADGRHSSLGQAPSNSDCRDWATRFHNAIDYGWFGWGTDDEAFERCVNELDETNIIEMVKAYDKTKSDDDKFFMALGADAGHGQKRKLYTHILNVLQTRAETLGLEDSIAEYVQGAVDELDDANISQTIVSEKLNAIVTIIREKEAEIALAKQG